MCFVEVHLIGASLSEPHSSVMTSRSLFVTRDNRKRGSASYIVREVSSVKERDTEREREREREREWERRKWRHLSSAEIGEEACTYPCQNTEIGEEFCTSPSQKFAPQFIQLKWRFVHTFPCQNVALFETVRILRKIRTLRDRFTCTSVKWLDRGSKNRKKKKNNRISGFTVLLLIEKLKEIITKNYRK